MVDAVSCDSSSSTSAVCSDLGLAFALLQPRGRVLAAFGMPRASRLTSNIIVVMLNACYARAWYMVRLQPAIWEVWAKDVSQNGETHVEVTALDHTVSK